MKKYKFTDATNSVVHIIDPDGVSRGSMLASCVPDGASVAPADPLPPLSPQEQIEAIEKETEACRFVREGLLRLLEKEVMVDFGVVDQQEVSIRLASVNPGYARMKNADQKITNLRIKIRGV